MDNTETVRESVVASKPLSSSVKYSIDSILGRTDKKISSEGNVSAQGMCKYYTKFLAKSWAYCRPLQ